MEDDGDDDDHSNQIKEKNLEFLKSKLKKKFLNFEELFGILLRNNWFKSSYDKKNKKKCFIFTKKENSTGKDCLHESLAQALFSYSDDKLLFLFK